jgi:CHAD domain-containing protein
METLLGRAARETDAKKAALCTAVAGGALVAAKIGLDRRSSSEDVRRFRVRDGERVSDGLRRIACAQLDMSIERLEGHTDEEFGAAVHETRKSQKRLRAILRLARDELGDDLYRRENSTFRDAGRRLAGARDGQVLLEALDALDERYPDEAPPARFDRFRAMLADQRAAAQRRLREGDAIAEVVSELRAARDRVPDWPLEHEGFDGLAPGLRRIYRRARRGYRDARREPGTESLHELRKRVKDLWYAGQVVRPVAPKKMRRIARRAHQLSSVIGEDHDLAILGQRVSDSAGSLRRRGRCGRAGQPDRAPQRRAAAGGDGTRTVAVPQEAGQAGATARRVARRGVAT